VPTILRLPERRERSKEHKGEEKYSYCRSFKQLMNLAVERSTFYRIIIITNTINRKEVTRLLGTLQYNFVTESMNLKDNINTHTHTSRNDKCVGNSGEGRLSIHIPPICLKKASD